MIRVCLVITLVTAVFGLSACSTKQVYENVQTNQTQTCDRLVNDGARAECLEGLDMGYRHYQQARDQLLEQGDH